MNVGGQKEVYVTGMITYAQTILIRVYNKPVLVFGKLGKGTPGEEN